MKMFSAGEAARELGVTRDQIQTARKNGIPENLVTVGGRYYYDEKGISELFEHFNKRGVTVTAPSFNCITTPI